MKSKNCHRAWCCLKVERKKKLVDRVVASAIAEQALLGCIPGSGKGGATSGTKIVGRTGIHPGKALLGFSH